MSKLVDGRLALVLTNMDIIMISSLVGLAAISGVVIIYFPFCKRRKARNNIPSGSKEFKVES